jgi:hypothetical protein
MKSKKLIFTLALLFLSSFTSAAQTVADEKDFQSWNDVQITAPMGKRADFILTGTARFGGNLRQAVDQRLSIAFNLKINDWLSVQPSYTHISTTPVIGRNRIENRLSFAATYKFPFKKFGLSNRSLFERRFRTPLNSTRYRNRLLFDLPLKKFYDTRFFASNEVFYDWSLKRWPRNRFAAGLGKAVNKNLGIDVYYMRQNDSTTRPGDLHIIGTTFRLRAN